MKLYWKNCWKCLYPFEHVCPKDYKNKKQYKKAIDAYLKGKP